MARAPSNADAPPPPVRTIREGAGPRLYTIGYEKRSGAGLIAALRAARVDTLADVRAKPKSRRPEFNAGPLRALCEAASIAYEPFPTLGATERQMEIHAEGDIPAFRRLYRARIRRSCNAEVARLADMAKHRTIALLCYEREHEICHRGVLAEVVGARIDARVEAID